MRTCALEAQTESLPTSQIETHSRIPTCAHIFTLHNTATRTYNQPHRTSDQSPHCLLSHIVRDRAIALSSSALTLDEESLRSPRAAPVRPSETKTSLTSSASRALTLLPTAFLEDWEQACRVLCFSEPHGLSHHPTHLRPMPIPPPHRVPQSCLEFTQLKIC